MTTDEIRNYPLEVTCDVTTDQVAPQVYGCAFFLREIAAQLAEFNGNFRMIHGIEPPSLIEAKNGK